MNTISDFYIAAINSVISSRRAAEERQRQAFMELYATYRDRDFRFYLHDLLWQRDITTYKEYMESSTIEKLAGDNAVFAFYEGIGFFVKNGSIYATSKTSWRKRLS